MMALDRTKILYGVTTVTLLTGSTAQVTLTSVKDEAVKLSGSENIQEKEIADGSKTAYSAGCELSIEATWEELNNTDLGKLDTVDKVTVAYGSGQTLTLDGNGSEVAGYIAKPEIDGSTAKFTLTLYGAAGTHLDDLYTEA